MKVLRDRIKSGESDSLEFKSSFDKEAIVDMLLKGDYRSSVRNRKIADMFKEVGLVEKYGSGIRRMVAGFEEYGLPAPKFQEISDGFMVTVYRGAIVNQKTTQKTTQKILDLVRDNPAGSRRELAERLGISEDGVKYHLDKLKKAGRIRRVGPDRGGFWEVSGEDGIK